MRLHRSDNCTSALRSIVAVKAEQRPLPQTKFYFDVGSDRLGARSVLNWNGKDQAATIKGLKSAPIVWTKAPSS